MELPGWRKSLLIQIRRRNHRERDPFLALIASNSVMRDKLLIPQMPLSPVTSYTDIPQGAVDVYQQKIYSLQDELTNMLREKALVAQQLIGLNVAVKEKEETIRLGAENVTALSQEVQRISESNLTYQQCLSDALSTNQMLVDEHTSMRTSFGVFRERCGRLERLVGDVQRKLDELTRIKQQGMDELIEMNKHHQEKEKYLHHKMTDLRQNISQLEESNTCYQQCLKEACTANKELHEEQLELHGDMGTMDELLQQVMEDNSGSVEQLLAIKGWVAANINEQLELREAQLEGAGLRGAGLIKRAESSGAEVYEMKTEGALPEGVELGVEVNTKESELSDVTKQTKASSREENGAAATGLDFRILHSGSPHGGAVTAVSWAPTSRRHVFATGGADCKVRLWTCKEDDHELRVELAGSRAGILALTYDQQESMLMAVCKDFKMRLWSLDDYKLKTTLSGHQDRVSAACFLGNGGRVVAGSKDRTLRLWDISRPKRHDTIVCYSNCTDLVTLDNSHVISGHFDRQIRFWDTRVESSVAEVSLQGPVTSLDLSQSGRSLLCSVCCCRDDSIVMLDLRKNTVVDTFSTPGFRTGCARFSPDARHLLLGATDGILHIWNGVSCRPLHTLTGHRHSIQSCSWHVSGDSILSCDSGNTLICWTNAAP